VKKSYHTVIIGAGFSGLCMAIKLREAGVEDFLILEKAEDVGGTWRDNHYPGAECDVPSSLYSYSFERKTDWDYQWSEQPQILEYIHKVTQKHGLQEKIQFGSEVAEARFDEAASTWEITLNHGETFSARYLITAVGQLHQPNTPEIMGSSSFSGAQFHSAQWDHSVDLAGKSVAVVGNAASAVQFVPPIAEDVGKLTIYQRSPNWLAKKLDRPYTDREKSMMRQFPFVKTLARFKTYLRNELLVYPTMKGNPIHSWLIRQLCMSYLKRVVKDERLRSKLIPDYPIGAKRVLTANGYYEALVRDNVDLVTDGIDHIDEQGITTADGAHRNADVIIYGTGFITNPFIYGINVIGQQGRELSEHWSSGAHAYLGVATHNFPNLFFLYGPNTNLGHNSILLMAEAQVAYIIQAMKKADTDSADTVEVREQAETIYDKEIQRRLNKMAWRKIEDSWYKSGARVTNNWPGSVGEYRRIMRSFDSGDFDFQTTAE
jgi:cation diffusion facilitator CzcD-associated flavoprotein CzcO